MSTAPVGAVPAVHILLLAVLVVLEVGSDARGSVEGKLLSGRCQGVQGSESAVRDDTTLRMGLLSPPVDTIPEKELVLSMVAAQVKRSLHSESLI